MIWEQKISILVMLTKLEEDKAIKAHRYWPTKGEKIYGDIKVTLISNKSKHNDDYRVRLFAVQRVRHSEQRKLERLRTTSITYTHTYSLALSLS
jgi:protein tyrosine phosphatase